MSPKTKNPANPRPDEPLAGSPPNSYTAGMVREPNGSRGAWWREGARSWIPMLAIGVTLLLSIQSQMLGMQRQIGDLRAEIRDVVRAEVRKEIAALRHELKGDMEILRAELKADMETLRTELKADMETLRTELRADMEALRTELKADMETLRTDLEGQIEALRTDLEGQTGALREEVAAMRDEVRDLGDRVTRLEITVAAHLREHPQREPARPGSSGEADASAETTARAG